MRRVARALIDKAMYGDVSAIKEVADRIDGRVPQLVGGDRDNPAQFQRIERVIVQLERQPQPLIEQCPLILSHGARIAKPLILLRLMLANSCAW
jgi:hypothetical protein